MRWKAFFIIFKELPLKKIKPTLFRKWLSDFKNLSNYLFGFKTLESLFPKKMVNFLCNDQRKPSKVKLPQNHPITEIYCRYECNKMYECMNVIKCHCIVQGEVLALIWVDFWGVHFPMGGGNITPLCLKLINILLETSNLLQKIDLLVKYESELETQLVLLYISANHNVGSPRSLHFVTLSNDLSI